MRRRSCAKPRLAEVEALIGQLEGGAKPKRKTTRDAGETFRDVATRWTSGELSRNYPDHVKAKARVRDDVGRLTKHVYPIVGEVPIASFSLDHAEAVMRGLPPTLAPKTRRHVGQLVHRVLALAVFPMRIREASPLPRGWLPKAGGTKAKTHLFPDEEAQLLACTAVPLPRRIAYAFLAREGMRKSEATRVAWSDIDLERGAVTLDMNKTSEPRAWALGKDVRAALARWREMSEEDVVFAGAGVLRSDDFRDDLRSAGLTRPQLFERNDRRQPIRVHDLRGTFVTLALAAGRSEAWVADRTGHRSSQMINVYRRPARAAAANAPAVSRQPAHLQKPTPFVA